MRRVEKLFYRILIFVLRDGVKYNSFVIDSDKDLQVLFHCRRQFPKVKTPELLTKLVDVACSSRASNQNPQSSVMTAASRLMPLGASSSVPGIVPEAVLVASPYFAADLNCNFDGKIGDNQPFGELAIAMASTSIIPIFRKGGAPDGIEDVL
ncbi:hypothetical protein Ahy_B08g092570 [Arachis hypogaea]|uniref:Uncharacterized protein n=1 Tax=Arachis hypogaea TaxID=3818 RepID=A0A444Y4D0_ARAHY|nr:hypothetical protein Ahy_B08g092570 [Arachis hypogaea]